jgi:hypothetical protein
MEEDNLERHATHSETEAARSGKDGIVDYRWRKARRSL